MRVRVNVLLREAQRLLLDVGVGGVLGELGLGLGLGLGRGLGLG